MEHAAPDRRDANVIEEPAIDPAVVRYSVIVSNAPLLLGCVTSPLLIVSIPITIWWFQKRYERLRVTLTKKFLKIERGFLFFEQKTIPLDKITDLAVYQNPVLKWMGLKGLRVETAGQGGGRGAGGALVDIVGVPDPEGFRDVVLAQRDAIEEAAPEAGEPARAQAAAQDGGPHAEASVALLAEIRDALARIETSLRRD